MLGNKDIIGFIPTRNAANARTFYENVLGLEFQEDDHFAIVMNANGIDIRIVNVGQDFTPFPFTILGWAVDDIEEAVTTLTSKGVVFEKYDGLPPLRPNNGGLPHDDLGIWSAPDGAKVAWFKDPDGNVLSVSQDSE